MRYSDTHSCLLSSKFDWAVSAVAGKWSSPQQSFAYQTSIYDKFITEDAYPFEVIDTRLRIRGTGRVLSLRYESEEGKDFNLLGFSIPIVAQTEG